MPGKIHKVYVPQLSSGHLSDYADYLQTFLEAGGQLQGISDDLWTGRGYNDSLFVAREDCHVPEAHGSAAITVVAPAGITVTSGGHNDILLIDDPLANSRALLSIDRLTADLLRNQGLTLSPDHFTDRAQENKDEFLWQLDRLNGHGLIERFRRAHDDERLTKPVILKRLNNFGSYLDRYPSY